MARDSGRPLLFRAAAVTSDTKLRSSPRRWTTCVSDPGVNADKTRPRKSSVLESISRSKRRLMLALPFFVTVATDIRANNLHRLINAFLRHKGFGHRGCVHKGVRLPLEGVCLHIRDQAQRLLGQRGSLGVKLPEGKDFEQVNHIEGVFPCFGLD